MSSGFRRLHPELFTSGPLRANTLTASWNPNFLESFFSLVIAFFPADFRESLVRQSALTALRTLAALARRPSSTPALDSSAAAVRKARVTRVKASVRTVAFVAVTAGIVFACLWPFHAPPNDVSWLPDSGGIHFGRRGTLISRRALTPELASSGQAWTLEAWLRPHTPYQQRVILAFYNPQLAGGLSLRQSAEALVVEKGPWPEVRGPHVQALETGSVFSTGLYVFLTVTSGLHGTGVYADGRLASSAPELQIPADYLSGRIVVANSPVVRESWAGDVRGLAIYDREFTGTEVNQNYESWARTGRPPRTRNDGIVALYLFTAPSGRTIPNQAGQGPDLYIPARFSEVHQVFLERPWDEYRAENFWNNVVANIIGFVPLGFFGYSFFVLFSRVRRPALATVAFGCTLSLTIEVLQAFLPTRFSGMTDIMTNTLGTAFGALISRYAGLVSEALARRNVPLSRLAGVFVGTPRDNRATLASVPALQERERR